MQFLLLKVIWLLLFYGIPYEFQDYFSYFCGKFDWAFEEIALIFVNHFG